MDCKIQVSCKVEEVLFTVRGETLKEVKALYQEMYDQALIWVGQQSDFEQHRSHPPAPVEEQLRPAPRRLETQAELASGQVVCPEHGKALMGKYGLYCPSKLADDTWCKWRPGRKAAA